ncbi:MAG: glutaminase [Candidatus Micrarchaeota archaeon]|nr:glutaminase [Candidatus Micrarchaeota archaeon]
MDADIETLFQKIRASRSVDEVQTAPTLKSLGITEKSVSLVDKWAIKLTSYGILAAYIPELKKVDKALTAIAVGDIHGNRVIVGNGAKIKISAQSVIKPFLYLYALEMGAPAKSISGLEASSMPFNTDKILRPELQMQVPEHPLNNAGAISSAGVIRKFPEFVGFMRRVTGNPGIGVLDRVFESEFNTNNNNRAIASRLVASGRFKNAKEGEEAYANYTRACSLGLTIGDVLNASLVLSSGGAGMRKKGNIAQMNNIVRVLSAMNTFGLYEQSGLFSLMVSGARANTSKSAVSGLIISINPGVGAFVTYSPLLNVEGNSVYGLYAMIPLNNLLALPGGMRLDSSELNRMLREYNMEESIKVHHKIISLMKDGENSKIFRIDEKILAQLKDA